MPVTAGDDNKLTTASHSINCRTIWEAQTRDPTTKELVKFLDPKDKESNKWPESKIKAMMMRTKKFRVKAPSQQYLERTHGDQTDVHQNLPEILLGGDEG